MTNTHDRDGAAPLQVGNMLSNPLVKETASALKAQGFYAMMQYDLDNDEEIHALAADDVLDPVTASLWLIGRAELSKGRAADYSRMPKELAEALQLKDATHDLYPFEMLPVYLENGKPWALKTALLLFEEGVMMMGFNSTPNAERINREIAEAALIVIDGLVEKNRWKDVPPKMISYFTGMVDRVANQFLLGKVVGRALKSSLGQLKQAMEQEEPVAPAAHVQKLKPGSFDFG